jgi:transcriptional regulator with XRE-family HTH domain
MLDSTKISSVNPKPESICGRGLKHRKLTDDQRTCLAADLVSGHPFKPSLAQVCSIVGVTPAAVRDELKRRAETNGGTAIELNTFGERLRWLRTGHSESQGALAKATHCSRSAASQWEKNGNLPTAAKLRVISERFGTSLEWLLYGEGQAPVLPAIAARKPRLSPSEIAAAFTGLTDTERDETILKIGVAVTWDVLARVVA